MNDWDRTVVIKPIWARTREVFIEKAKDDEFARQDSRDWLGE
jgi:hypothetical protein